MTPGPSRREELAEGLAGTEARIGQACRDAGRERSSVGLIVVTKTFPASDVRLLHELGVRDVAENRDQEAAAKAAACAELDLRWHFVGQLQSNKARSVASYASAVHSVDRASLVAALATGVEAAGRATPLDLLLQVNLSDDPARGGIPVDQLAALDDLADRVQAHAGLRVRGVMAVAPLATDPRPAFARLADASERLRERHPDASWISAGMSGDLEAAVAAGATHLRVGSAILGSRPPVR